LVAEGVPETGLAFSAEINERDLLGRTIVLLEEPQMQESNERSGAAGETPKRARILLIDDEPLVLRTLCRVFERAHEVVALGEATVALERLRAGERFDVIFCDLMMPNMSGMDFHEELSRGGGDERALADRIIFLSGGVFTPRAASFLEQVKNQRVEKPFDFRKLQALVAEALK
jgi:CheY-like chemotaxis protein